MTTISVQKYQEHYHFTTEYNKEKKKDQKSKITELHDRLKILN